MEGVPCPSFLRPTRVARAETLWSTESRFFSRSIPLALYCPLPLRYFLPLTLGHRRCVIQNKMWQSPEFRKIHIELAYFVNTQGEVPIHPAFSSSPASNTSHLLTAWAHSRREPGSTSCTACCSPATQRSGQRFPCLGAISCL